MFDEGRILARCRGFDFAIEDHGLPTLNGHFEYEGGSCQGMGYMVDTAFLFRFLEAVGVSSLRELEGKSCWVTHTHDKISKIEPLHKKDGTPFIIEEWGEWVKRRAPFTAHELRTGKIPK